MPENLFERLPGDGRFPGDIRYPFFAEYFEYRESNVEYPYCFAAEITFYGQISAIELFANYTLLGADYETQNA